MTAVVWPITKLIWTNWTSATSLKVLNRLTAHHDTPTASEAGVPALLLRGESVLIPTEHFAQPTSLHKCHFIKSPQQIHRQW